MRKGGIFLIILFLNLAFFVPKTFLVKAEGLDHLVISEVQIAGGTPTDEFVEIYNPTSSTVNLGGYRLSKKTSGGTISNLLTSFAPFDLAPLNYYLLTHPNGYDDTVIKADAVYSSDNYSIADNNTVILYSDDGHTVVDKAGFGNVNDFEGLKYPNNPPANQSIGRKWADGYSDTNDNSADFEIQAPTPKAQNVSPPPPPPPTVYSTKIYLNEIFPSPSAGEEWIEIVNGDTVAVNLDGWTIEDVVGTTKVYTIGNVDLEPDGFKVFYKSDTGITLNNTGDKLILKNPDEEMVSEYEYSNTPNDKSWSRKEEGVDDWTSDWPASPGASNVAPANHYPVANAGSNIVNAKTGETLNFNGSASSDYDGTIVSYEWNFGDGSVFSGAQVVHSYSTVGTYQVSLTVRDNSSAASTSSITVTVVAGEIQYQNDYSTDIKITEILPNPAGSDAENEYIKIYNFGSRDVNLRNWSLDDEEGGSKPFKIDYDLIIKPKTVATFYSADTKLSLNNSGDSARLFDPDNKIMDDIAYIGPVIEGATYTLENGKWSWENIAAQPDSDSQIKKDTTPAPVENKDTQIKTETKIPDVKKIAITEPPIVANQALVKKNEIPEAKTINEVIIASGALLSAANKETELAPQRNTVSNDPAGTQIVQSKTYQKPVVVFSSVAVSLFLIAKILFHPEDWKKIWQKLFESQEKNNKDFENLFK